MQALENRLRLLQLEANTKDKEFTEAKQRLLKLAKEKGHIDNRYKEALESVMESAETQCRDLCTRMQEKLPIEIRSAVYQYLCIYEQPIPIGPYFHFRKLRGEYKTEWIPANIPHDTLLCLYPTYFDDDDEHSAPLPFNLGQDLAEEDAQDAELLNQLTIRLTNPSSHTLNGTLTHDTPRPTTLQDGRQRHSHLTHPAPGILLPGDPVFSPNLLGAKTAQELGEMYYGANTFTLCSVPTAPSALLTHPATTSLKPIDHMASLQFRIKAEHMPMLPPGITSSPTAAAAEVRGFKYESQFLQHFTSMLEALMDVLRAAKPVKRTVEVILMTSFPSTTTTAPASQGPWGAAAPTAAPARPQAHNRPLANMLQILRGPVYNLMHELGYNVRVTHHDDALWAFPKDLTGLFALRRDRWAVERAAQGDTAQWEWNRQFLVAPRELRRGSERSEMTTGLVPDYLLEDFVKERWGVVAMGSMRGGGDIVDGRFWPVNTFTWE